MNAILEQTLIKWSERTIKVESAGARRRSLSFALIYCFIKLRACLADCVCVCVLCPVLLLTLMSNYFNFVCCHTAAASAMASFSNLISAQRNGCQAVQCNAHTVYGSQRQRVCLFLFFAPSFTSVCKPFTGQVEDGRLQRFVRQINWMCI